MKRMCIFALLVGAVFAAAAARADEFDDLRTRWRTMLTFGTNASPADPLYASWLATLNANAQSYLNAMSNGPARSYLWKAYDELATNSSDITGTYERLRTMALAYSVKSGSALETNATLLNAIVSGLDWMHANYYTPTGAIHDNWFDFTIATPLALNDIVVLLYTNLSPSQISNYMSSVEFYTPAPDLTAANRVWKSMVVALRGVIVKDAGSIDAARLALSDVFPDVTSGDGFYADGSFIFHNFFPYNGGYGIEMLDTLGSMMQLLQGSTWAVRDPAQANVFRWVRDGYAPFIHRGALMQMVDGRYHTRTGNDHAQGHELLGAVLRLAQVAPPADAAAYKSFVKAAIQSDTSRDFVSSERPPYNVWANAILRDPAIVTATRTVEHRQFPGMDRVVHRRPGWTYGLAMWSSRVANYESTRGENLRGWFTAEGMGYLYNDDLDHYADGFWATVDPYRLPGTTVDVLTRTNASGDGRRSQNSHVGGATIQGLYGVVAMHLNAWNSNLSARKGWFMFDEEIVCLGNSVSSSNSPPVQVETTIENRRLGLYGNNPFTVNGAPKPSSPGWSETMNATSWAHLAGTVPGSDIGYYFPTPQSVKALRESRSGALSDINVTYGATNRLTRHYLTMWFDHGTNPTSGTYSYVLLPNKSADEVAAYAAAPEITVLANNSNVQAVRKAGLGITALNFWRDQTNTSAGVTCDRRACVIFRHDGAILEVGIADPTQTNSSGITIEIATNVTALLSADPAITVVQLSPTLKFTVNTSNSLGTTLRAQFAVTSIQTNILLPAADSYVQTGAQAITNFGLASTLQVKTNASPGQTREAYLRFDLSAVSNSIVSATLRLVPTTTNDPLIHAVAVVPDNSWTETGLVWTNKPPSAGEFARWTVPAQFTPVVVPITTLAQQAWAADKRLSLRVYSTGMPPPSNGGFTAYGSLNGSSAYRPQLTVASVRRLPTVVLSASDALLNAPGSVILNAEAQDIDGAVASVDYYNGGTRVGQSLAPPYTATLSNLSPGEYRFTAVATDNSGLASTSAPVSVAVFAPEPSGRGTGLNADYFSDRNLTALALSRVDPTVNFTWGSLATPAPQVPPDFSARWTGKLQARRAGTHLLHTITDEGVRLWIDGQLIIDHWTPHVQAEDVGAITLLPGRYYDIVMEFFDGSASAAAQLYWTEPGGDREIVPRSQLYPADQGLRATYYSGTNFGSAVLSRIDPLIQFNWGTNSPEPTLLPGPFSARWIGRLKAPWSGIYSLFISSDDAVRFSINGQSVISNFTAHSLSEDSNTIALVAGQYYDVNLDYFNASGSATVILMWQPPGQAKQVIPASAFTPHRINSPPVLAPIPTVLAARNFPVSLTAAASDPDTPAQSLAFSLDPGGPAGASVNATSGVFSWTPGPEALLGTSSVTVRVSDGADPEMTDAVTFNIVVLTNTAGASLALVPAGATWRYLDTGTDQGTSWRGTAFNDTAWKSGAAPLGYGMGDEATVTSFGANPGSKHITTYFRRAFYVPDAALVQKLTARAVRDDGIIVYLNGTEVWRDNMPPGTLAGTTLASSEIAGPGQTQFISKTLSTGSLVSGNNVLAVEVHQDSPATPDARFDFELVADAFVPADTPLKVSRSATATTLAWPAAAGLLRPYASTNLTPPAQWQPLATTPVLSNGQWTATLPFTSNGTVFFRLQTP